MIDGTDPKIIMAQHHSISSFKFSCNKAHTIIHYIRLGIKNFSTASKVWISLATLLDDFFTSKTEQMNFHFINDSKIDKTHSPA